jgi:beta-galactosidase/beta-glucuronidase
MADWQPVSGHIMTRWAAEVSPEEVWPEYPRPQMRRPVWLNLNGLWEYAITTKSKAEPDFKGHILVPFAIESALSGVKRPLKPRERLWYRRSFTIPEGWAGQRVLLHFGAVDWEAVVWVNQVEVGTHRGGYLPFYFDITGYLGEGQNQVVVRVWDPTDKSWGARGKQVLKPKSIWYTSVSGIWGTVWLEPVPQTYIRQLKLTPDIDTESLKIEVLVSGDVGDLQVLANAKDRKGRVGVISRREAEALHMPVPAPHLWEPDDPRLYDLEVEIYQGGSLVDRVQSYFGMRKFSLAPDQDGHLRLWLNNQPLFHYGPLDQGYWPDGLYTPPNEAAMRYEVEFLKKIGCNMLRKHVKVESARFYYACDRLGMIVWQDMPNGSKPVGAFLSFLANMFSRLKRRDDHLYWRAGRSKPAAREDYWRELAEMVDQLHNFTCIGMWVPFNEAWGQFDANKVADWLKETDPTRPVDHASGWFDQGGGDFRSIHTYFKTLKPEKPDSIRAVILSEFGGYALKLDGHLWNQEAEFGYRKFDSSRALTEAYLDLLETQLKPWIEMGLSGAVYTQTSDVEIEVNGYLTYDRQVEKMDHERITVAHQALYDL